MMSGSRSLLARAAELEALGTRGALVTVVKTTGSTPREAGARMIVLAEAGTEGTVGGGRVEEVAIEEARRAIREGRTIFLELALTQELGMCCGGTVCLFIEPLGSPPRLIVFGAGHVGAALTRLAGGAGFWVHVVDEREDLLRADRLPDAQALHDDLEDPALPFGPETFVLVTTHDHALDQRLVERALKRPHRWLGLIGSRRKAELTRQRLAHKGFEPGAIARVRSPVGVAIGAETPEEIAVSILAELIAERRGVKLDAEGSEAARVRLETKT